MQTVKYETSPESDVAALVLSLDSGADGAVPSSAEEKCSANVCDIDGAFR